MVRNKLQQGTVLPGHTFNTSGHWANGLMGVLQEMIRLPLPSITSPRIVDLLHTNFNIIFFSILIIFIIILWRYPGKTKMTFMNFMEYPSLIFLFLYLFLYIIVQPFSSFEPMDTRDALSVLCLLQVWIISNKINLNDKYCRYAIFAFLLFNGILRLGFEAFEFSLNNKQLNWFPW
jgi:hypothetical protein